MIPTSSAVCYVFTALHCIRGPRSNGAYPYELEHVSEINVGFLRPEDETPQSHLSLDASHVVQDVDNDLAVLIVDKSRLSAFQTATRIELSYRATPSESFRAMGFPKFKDSRRQLIEFGWSDGEELRKFEVVSRLCFQLEGSASSLGGFSGAGLFLADSRTLLGIVSEVVCDKSSDSIVADLFRVTRIDKKRVNRLLKEHAECNPQLPRESADRFELVTGEVDCIDYEGFLLGDVKLNLWQALDRLKNDARDDWFHDPLGMKDMFRTSFVVSLLKEKHWGASNQVYEPSNAGSYLVPKKGYTARKAIVPSFLDGVVYQALVDVLAEDFDLCLVNSVYSFRYNTDPASNRKYFFFYSIELWKKFQEQIENQLDDDSPYLLCTDLSHYFDHIGVAKLIEHLKELARDASRESQSSTSANLLAAIDMLEILLTKWASDSNFPMGIPQNRDASSFLANMMLHAVDQCMVRRFDYYRYMDDVRVICRSKAEAQQAIMVLTRQLGKYGLNLNAAKTLILHKDTDQDKLQPFLPRNDDRLERIDNLLRGGRSRGVQIGVAQTLDLFCELLERKDTESAMRERKLGFCVQRLARFARQPFLSSIIPWGDVIELILPQFEEQPWATGSLIGLFSSLDSELFSEAHYEVIEKLVLEPDSVVYDWQAYHLWKWLAQSRYQSTRLTSVACELVLKTNPEHVAMCAGACLYLAATNQGAHWRLILESLNQGQFRDFLAQRAAIVALRQVEPHKITWSALEPTLKSIHAQLHEAGEDEYVSPPPTIKLKDVLRDLPSVISPSFI